MKKSAILMALAATGAASVGFAQQDVTVTWMTGNTAQSFQFAQESAQRYMDANPHTIGGEVRLSTRHSITTSCLDVATCTL